MGKEKEKWRKKDEGGAEGSKKEKGMYLSVVMQMAIQPHVG